MKEGMKDNRKVGDMHQEGIGRVKQRKGDMEVGQGGSMSGGWNHKGSKEGHWKRPNNADTPRRA